MRAFTSFLAFVLTLMLALSVQIMSCSVEPQSTQRNQETRLQDYEFETVAVDFSGMVESRSRRKTKLLAENLGDGVMLEMVEIPGGTFLMGSPESEEERGYGEGPQHRVTVPKFYMGKYEVTQAQWRKVAKLPKVNLDLDPERSQLKGDNLPVDNVFWLGAAEFCDRLSRATGRKYRLPSEAEWEYACRAGTTTPYHFGRVISTELANYDEGYSPTSPYRISKSKPKPVGSMKIVNGFGLFDMHGNVWELVQDSYHSNYDGGAPTDGSAWGSVGNDVKWIIRGGSWKHGSKQCRCAYRSDYLSGRQMPGVAYDYLGFRVAMSVN